MNDDHNGRKTLLPEFLPAPSAPCHDTATLASPKERVAQRARVFLERFRGLGTAAGAAVLSLQCSSGYGVVDPLPPPPQQCTVLPDPFPLIRVTARFDGRGDAGQADVVLDFHTDSFPGYVGFRIEMVQVSGGALVGISDRSNPGSGLATQLLVSIAPASGTTELTVDVSFACGSAVSTRRYRVVYGGSSIPSGTVSVMEITPPVDAGP